MNISEIISAQHEFEIERVGNDMSLWEYNGNPDFACDRTGQELEELRYELKNGGTPKDKALEAIDVIIFMSGVLSHIAVENDIPTETIETWITEKLDKNKQKYKPEYFDGRTVEDGLQYSRDMWEPVPLGEWSGPEYINQRDYISTFDTIV